MAGTLLHFVYEWSGYSPLTAPFAAINESVWEHLKLLFFPALIWGLVKIIFNPYRQINEWAANAIGIFGGMFSIIAIFYIYTGILGFNIPAIDISLFFISVAVFLVLRNLILKNYLFEGKTANIISALLLAVTSAAFGVFSFYPPKISIFTTPQ